MALNEHKSGGAERDPLLERVYAETGREEPRAELDQAVRAAARREVRARPRALGARLRTWRLPISIAAVVVLSVSLVSLMREEAVDRLEEGFSPRTPEPGIPAAPPFGDAKLKASESAGSPGRAPAPAAQALPAPATDQAQRARRRDVPASIGGKRAEPFHPEIRQQGADAAKESALEQPAPAGDAAREAPSQGAARAPVPSIQYAPAEKEQDLAGTRMPNKSERSLTNSKSATVLQELDKAPPQAWLEKLEALRRQGQNDEADELLAEFRRRFPNHPVPVRKGGPAN